MSKGRKTQGVVYGLVAASEPDVVRYVGQTVAPLTQRVGGHRWRARNGFVAPVLDWIRGLLATGDDVRAVILERPANLDECEQRHIDRLRPTGLLLNARDAGQYGLHYPESRERIRIERQTNEYRKTRMRRGCAHGMAKLSDDDVYQIRQLRHDGGLLYKEIAELVGITAGTVGDIIRGHTWRHLPEKVSQ